MSQQTSAASFGLAEVLFVVFLILKLTDKIDWSWWWVTSPLWITFGVVFACILAFGASVVKR